MEDLLNLIDKNLEDSQVVGFLNKYSTTCEYEEDEDEYYISIENTGSKSFVMVLRESLSFFIFSGQRSRCRILPIKKQFNI